MKRGKDDEKIMGPMFPRLHVNDTEKGGPRAPPRNKMALYEQLSIPSQRFNPGLLPLNPNNTTNSVHPASSSQGSGRERAMFFPLQLPSSTHPAEKSYTCYSNSTPPLVQLEQKKKQDEDDFMVPVFVHSGGQDQSKYCNGICRERPSSLSPVNSNHSAKLQNVSDKEPKRTSITGLNLRQGKRQNGEHLKEFVSDGEKSVKSGSNLLSRERTEGPLKHCNAYSNYERTDNPTNKFSRLLKTNDGLLQDYRGNLRPGNALRADDADGVLDEPNRGIDDGNSAELLRQIQAERWRSSNDSINDTESCEDRAHRSLQTGNMDRDDDVSETSMVDSISCLNISPDDVVGIIGQKHFWKARRAIANQQRAFAVQVFELHRLIKVQRLIAGSPHLLLEDNAYLRKPLRSSCSKKLQLEYIVKAPPEIVKLKDNSEKPHHKMECSAENVVGKTSLSSVQNNSQPSNYWPFSGNGQPTTVPADAKVGPRSFHQPSGHQWLIPVMSPSEGLVYKPYPGPGFMSPVCGGCGPPGATPMMGNFLNSAYGVPAGHGYFPPYGMPVMNPATLGSAGKPMDQFAGQGHLSGSGANFDMQRQTSCNVPSQKTGTILNGVKLHASKGSDMQVSTASSPSERVQRLGVGHTTEGRDPLPLFPMSAAVHAPDGAPQPHDTESPARVIRVVPHNARSATESVAKIFQSIQEGRNQYDSA